jgi:hypothetical protein
LLEPQQLFACTCRTCTGFDTNILLLLQNDLLLLQLRVPSCSRQSQSLTSASLHIMPPAALLSTATKQLLLLCPFCWLLLQRLHLTTFP